MDTLTISVKVPTADGVTYYRVHVSLAFARRHDNFALVSLGWTVGKDLPVKAWQSIKRYARPISHEEWNHSGCQSSCTRRGHDRCSW